jgi:hypothetical protein
MDATLWLDAERLPFRSSTVDFLYCCHVLNTVRNDTAMMTEVARVLSARGLALLQVPVSESPTVDLADAGSEARRRLFGDDGILRLYGPDLAERLSKGGLSVRVEPFARDWPANLRQRYGLMAEDLYLCTRQLATAAGDAERRE